MGGPVQVISDLGGSITNLTNMETFSRGGGGGGGDIFSDIGNAFTQVTQPLEKAVTAGVEDTSKNLTTALQPAEKNVTQAVADTSKDLTKVLQPVEKTINYIGAHPELQAALILAVAVPVVGEAIGAELMAAGTITSAEAAYSAAITAGATATEAAAAAQAATTTASIMGTAIASTSAQVAQGVPFEQAVQNATVSAGVSALAPAQARKLDKLINSPAVTNAIVSTAASGIASAASGGSQQDVEKSMVAGLAGSGASSLYKGAIDPTSDVISRGVGGAAAGAVKGGTEGAVIGGLSSAGAAAARMPPEPDVPAPPPVAAPLDQTAAEDARLARKEASIAGSEKGAYMPSGSFVPPVEEPKQGAYLPDSATAQKDTSTIDSAPTKTPYKPDIFVSTYKTPKAMATGAASEALGQALGTTTGLTASRGAGEIEGTGTGGQRKKVWNEESLKLKDALGV
jgi:hypothetical protein